MPRINPYFSYFQKLTESGGRVELFVGIFIEVSAGFTLSVHDMATMVNSTLELSIEIYN